MKPEMAQCGMAERTTARLLMEDRKVIVWDGRHVPEELRKLPPGWYAVEPVDRVPALTEEEDQGIVAALAQLDAGRGILLADVLDDLRKRSSNR